MEPSSQPVTKADLNAVVEALEQRFQGRLDTVEQRITDRITETVRESETRLLQAFYFFAESNDRRHVQGEAATAVVVTRLATLESRVLNLEKRLNIPPAG